MPMLERALVGCEGLRSERWRVRVEIGDGGLEGEGEIGDEG